MATPPAAGGENPYGIIPALQQGGIVAQFTFGIMVIMSVGSWYIFFVKLFEQQKIINQGRRVRASFWNANSLREGGRLNVPVWQGAASSVPRTKFLRRIQEMRRSM